MFSFFAFWFLYFLQYAAGDKTVLDSITPELYVLDPSGNYLRQDDVAVPFNSPLTLICRTASVDASLTWQFAVVDSNDYRPVTESEYLVVGNEKNGVITLKLTKIRFSMAGTYRCSNRISSVQVNVHVYGILNAISSAVRLVPKKEIIERYQFDTFIFDTSTHPTLSCQFRVGRSGIKYTTVRWEGGKFATNPDLYELNDSADEVNGFIWSNLTLTHPSFDPGLYGKYKCLFNIVPGSMESEELEIRVPPIVKKPENLVGYHSGKQLSHSCEVLAYPPIIEPVRWFRNEQPIELGPDGRPHVSGIDWAGRVRFETDVYKNDRIVFDPVLPEDRAAYSCFVRSEMGNATGAFYLRVKDRWAILWPLIGIVLELIILIVVIVVYEIKRRKRAKLQENEDSPNPVDRNRPADYVGGGHTGSSDEIALRHRPVRA